MWWGGGWVDLVHNVKLPARNGHSDPAPEHDHKVGVAAVVDECEGGVDSTAYPDGLHTVSDVDPGHDDAMRIFLVTSWITVYLVELFQSLVSASQATTLFS